MRIYRHFIKIISYLTFIVLIITFSLTKGIAQTQYSLSYLGLDSKFLPNTKYADSTLHLSIANQILTKLRTNGYWTASIDQIQYSNDSVYFSFYQGRRFKEVTLMLSSNQLDLNQNQQATSLDQGVERLLIAYENHGFPFASIRLDSILVQEDHLQAFAQLESGPMITNDSLMISPEGLIKQTFLSQYLGMEYDKPYNEKAIKNINEKIQTLDFLNLKSVQTSFQLKRAKTILELEYLKVNYFDGILGVVPNQAQGGVLVTGELNLSLKNLFKSGKSFDMKWEKLTTETQKLMTEYNHPQLFGSPIDFAFSYHQIKQDSSFSNRSIETRLSYRPTPRWKIGINYENKLGNNLKILEAQGGDFQLDYYGINTSYTHLNNLLNPTKGWYSLLKSYTGKKEVTTDQLSSSIQYYFMSKSQIYFELSHRSVLYVAAQGALMINDYLFLNDLDRLGGLKSIRGFNEGEFFASKYAVMNLEWRFYTEKDSYLVTFVDQGFLSYDITMGQNYDQVTGIGAGFIFAAKGGNFQILYGMGKGKGDTFSIDRSKIHFGYSALF